MRERERARDKWTKKQIYCSVQPHTPLSKQTYPEVYFTNFLGIAQLNQDNTQA